MTIAVFIDSCAWNYFFDNLVYLGEVFPRDSYAMYLTREVEIELSAIPDGGKDGSDKRPLKEYIAKSIEANRITTTSIFGFASVEPDGSLSPIQVYGGFDQGTWQSDADRQWYGSDKVAKHILDRSARASGLKDNQADASLAVRAFDSIVVTDEHKSKKGPLKLAAEQGGAVLYLSDFRESSLSLKDYVASLGR